MLNITKCIQSHLTLNLLHYISLCIGSIIPLTLLALLYCRAFLLSIFKNYLIDNKFVLNYCDYIEEMFYLNGVPSIHLFFFFAHFASNILLFSENRTTENLCAKVKYVEKRVLQIKDKEQIFSDKAIF